MCMYSMPINWTQNLLHYIHIHRHRYERIGACIAYYGIHSIKTNLFVASLKCDSNQFSTTVIFFNNSRLNLPFCRSHEHIHADTLNARIKCARKYASDGQQCNYNAKVFIQT